MLKIYTVCTVIFQPQGQEQFPSWIERSVTRSNSGYARSRPQDLQVTLSWLKGQKVQRTCYQMASNEDHVTKRIIDSSGVRFMAMRS